MMENKKFVPKEKRSTIENQAEPTNLNNEKKANHTLDRSAIFLFALYALVIIQVIQVIYDNWGSVL